MYLSCDVEIFCDGSQCVVLNLIIFRGIVRRDSFWDWLVFKKIQDGLGGRVRLILTGSAPISKEVYNLMSTLHSQPL